MPVRFEYNSVIQAPYQTLELCVLLAQLPNFCGPGRQHCFEDQGNSEAPFVIVSFRLLRMREASYLFRLIFAE